MWAKRCQTKIGINLEWGTFCANVIYYSFFQEHLFFYPSF